MTIRCDLFSLMKNLSLALDFNREGINDHHRKVAFVAYILGEQIGLSLSEKSNLLYMGLIHDIGVSSWSEKDALSKFNFEELLMPTLFGGHLITVSGGCHGTPSKVASRLDIFANGGGRFFKVSESPPLLAVG